MADALYFETDQLEAKPFQEMPIGSLVRTVVDGEILIVAALPNSHNGEPIPVPVVISLGGEEPMTIWKADEFDGYMAVDLGPWSVEVEASTLENYAGTIGDAGHAFIRGKDAGLIGTAKFGQKPFPIPFLIDGSRATIGTMTAVRFSNWRIVSTTTDDRPVLYRSGL